MMLFLFLNTSFRTYLTAEKDMLGFRAHSFTQSTEASLAADHDCVFWEIDAF